MVNLADVVSVVNSFAPFVALPLAVALGLGVVLALTAGLISLFRK